MRSWPAFVGAALLLGACAHPWYTMDLPPGSTREQVIARAGAPLKEVPLPDGGRRMQYTLQPMGQYAFMVDLDAAGRVVRSRQVLTEASFGRIEPGRWTAADIDREFGPPARIDAVASFPGQVLTYRWKDTANTDMFYWVYVDAQGVVQRAHPGMEFHNDHLPNRP
jgi:hypothetical protein